MSTVKVDPPVVVHTPAFKKWGVPRSYVLPIVKGLGLDPLYAGVHAIYWYTNVEGCAKLLPNLILRSDLYKTDTFTCINYAFKMWNETSNRFGLNTWLPVIGKVPWATVKHAWNLILLGDESGLNIAQFLYFEPNEGYRFGEPIELAYQAFPMGQEGYSGELVFI